MAFLKSAKDFLDNLIGGATIDDKNEELNELAVKEMALYTAVSFVADLIAGCEIIVYENDKPVKNGNWYYWNVSANPNQSSKQLIFEWIFDYYTKGRGLIIPMTKGLYVADKFSVDEYPIKGDVYSGISIRTYAINKEYKADKVYFLGQGTKEIKKMLDGIFESYATLLTNDISSSSQGSGEKYVLNLETYPSGTPEEKEKYMTSLKESLSTFVNADSSAYVATKGQSLQRLSTASSTSSSDYISVRKEVYAIAAAALHIPASLLEGNSTASDQLFNQALTTAIDPLAQKISAELTRKTYSQDEILYKGCRIEVDTSNIKHVDVVDNADSLDKLIASGIMCIDEVRKRCNLPELNTDWSEKHYLTKNYSDIAEADPLERRNNEEES